MTIKQWFYKHPNITFVLLFLLMSYLTTKTLQHLADANWGRAIFNGVAAIVAVGYVVRWWENEQ
jgi:hypothetical protein